MRYLILTFSVFVLLIQPAEALDPKIEAEIEAKAKTLYIKGEFIWKAKGSNFQQTCWIIESDKISKPGINASYASDLMLGWETYKPWGFYCEDGIIFLPIGTVIRNSPSASANAKIRITSIVLNYEAHNEATGKNNYDPYAHEKREKKFKEHLEKK